MELKLPAKGFTFPVGKRDVFIITERKNKTENLARKILRRLMMPENPDTIRELLYYMQPAELEIKQVKSSMLGEEFMRPMWEIHGKGFGGRGGWVDDDSTWVFVLE